MGEKPHRKLYKILQKTYNCKKTYNLVMRFIKTQGFYNVFTVAISSLEIIEGINEF